MDVDDDEKLDEKFSNDEKQDSNEMQKKKN